MPSLSLTLSPFEELSRVLEFLHWGRGYISQSRLGKARVRTHPRANLELLAVSRKSIKLKASPAAVRVNE